MTEQHIPTELEKVIDLLESWADGRVLPADDFHGICYNLFLHDSRVAWERLVAKAAESWPEFSRNPRYPVAHPDLLPESAYTAKREVPKWAGEYGAARRRLCQHVANWLRAHPGEVSRTLWGR